MNNQQQRRVWATGSGLGIGGVGSDDHNIGNTGPDPYIRGHCSHGGYRYDEQCANCRRVTAICNECELCDRCHDK